IHLFLLGYHGILWVSMGSNGLLSTLLSTGGFLWGKALPRKGIKIMEEGEGIAYKKRPRKGAF
ncbi:MAG: hypothetical protein ACRC12_03760, partial [Holosporales bacterium]